MAVRHLEISISKLYYCIFRYSKSWMLSLKYGVSVFVQPLLQKIGDKSSLNTILEKHPILEIQSSIFSIPSKAF